MKLPSIAAYVEVETEANMIGPTAKKTSADRQKVLIFFTKIPIRFRKRCAIINDSFKYTIKKIIVIITIARALPKFCKNQ